MVGKIMKEDGSRIIEFVRIEDFLGLPKVPLFFTEHISAKSNPERDHQSPRTKTRSQETPPSVRSTLSSREISFIWRSRSAVVGATREPTFEEAGDSMGMLSMGSGVQRYGAMQ